MTTPTTTPTTTKTRKPGQIRREVYRAFDEADRRLCDALVKVGLIIVMDTEEAKHEAK